MRRRLHDDMILVLRSIDHRNLALPKGVVEGIVDLVDIEPEARRGGAIDDEVDLEAVLLLIEIDLGQARYSGHGGFDLGRPFVDRCRVVALHRVLV